MVDTMYSPSDAIALQRPGMAARAAAEAAARKAIINAQPADASKQPESIAKTLARAAGILQEPRQQGGKPAARKKAVAKKKKTVAKKKKKTAATKK